MAVEDKLAIFKRLSQEPMLRLMFWNETVLNMNLKIKSLSTTSWVPGERVWGFMGIIHEVGLMVGPHRALVSDP